MVMGIPLRTKSSGLYRHREDLGLHRVGYKERNLHIRSPSLPSTPRRVPSGHGCSLRIFTAHQRLVPLPTSAHGALQDRWPHPVDPRDPSGGPGTIPVTPETFPMAKTGLPIYESLPPDHSGTPRDVRDLIRDSKQLSGFRILVSLQP